MNKALIALPVAASIALLTACGGSSGKKVTSSTPASKPASSASSSSSPSPSPTPKASGVSLPSNEDGPTPGGTDQPGGDSDARKLLAGYGWIDGTGRVIAGKVASESDELNDDQTAAVDQALCDYAFGTLSQVQTTTAAHVTLKLDTDNTGSDGSGALACAYVDSASTDSSPDDVFIIAVGVTKDIDDSNDGGQDVNKLAADSGHELSLGYSPNYTGATLSASNAKAWLTAAAARVDASGLTAS